MALRICESIRGLVRVRGSSCWGLGQWMIRLCQGRMLSHCYGVAVFERVGSESRVHGVIIFDSVDVCVVARVQIVIAVHAISIRIHRWNDNLQYHVGKRFLIYAKLFEYLR